MMRSISRVLAPLVNGTTRGFAAETFAARAGEVSNNDEWLLLMAQGSSAVLSGNTQRSCVCVVGDEWPRCLGVRFGRAA
eukprot:1159398-Pelagomonas_calceolata.AAC.7